MIELKGRMQMDLPEPSTDRLLEKHSIGSLQGEVSLTCCRLCRLAH